MLTVQDQQLDEYTRYEAYRLYEEKTDLGERLTIPIHNSSELLIIDGHVYGRMLDGTLKRMTLWAEESYVETCQDRAFDGANAIERERREIEWQEAIAVEALKPGEMLEVFSPIPDTVRAGKTTLSGYRQDIARTFGRAYYHNGSRILTTTYSLEQSNKQALEAAATVRHMNIRSSMSSEQILRSRRVSRSSKKEFELLADQVRYHYDQSLYQQAGTVYYAGNILTSQKDSMSFIDQQQDLVAQHMRLLADIQLTYTNAKERGDQSELLRQRTAAALDERLHGGMVLSLSDTSVDDRLASGDYTGDCVTGATSTQSELGLSQGKHLTNCPLCGTRGVTATVSGETITCSECLDGVNICTGKVIKSRQIRRPEMTKPNRFIQSESKLFPTKKDNIKRLYGEKAVLKTVFVTGGADRLVVHEQTGEVLAKA